jgi:DNA-binding response OmpR family regulator
MDITILIIEDEVDIASMVAERLRSEGFVTETCHDGLQGVERAAELRPDLVVLDLMLPGLDGVEVCRRIQSARRTPLVMLTAKDDEADMLIGLGVGADDYLTKPFSVRELVARIRAVLRRSGETAATGDERIEIGDVVLDVSRRLAHRGGVAVHLTALEFDLVLALATSQGAVMTREQLLYKVWGYRDSSGHRTVDSHVRSVRRKLGAGIIRTVHSVGYALGVAPGAMR